jgi:hypothetical protein
MFKMKVKVAAGKSSFENKGLRRIFGPKKEEISGIWRKLHVSN